MDSKKYTLLLWLAMSVCLFSCQTEDVEESPVDLDDETRRSGLVARYAVSGDQLTLIQNGSASTGFYNSNRQNELWSFFTGIIPIQSRSTMQEWELFADEEDGTAAYVTPLNDNNLSAWQMGHNLAYVWNSRGELVRDETAFVSIHELAHLLTLNHEQINVGGRNCGEFFTGEGCSTSNSYINLFFEQFWQDIYAENQSISEDDADGLFQFYEKYRSQFVSEYAATNPGEDIAESFAYYVLNSSILGNSISAQKMRFFQQFDELVSLRNEIRSRINFNVNLNGISAARSERFRALLSKAPRF